MRTFESDFDSVFGYDGLSPFEERRLAARRRANDMLDSRDPDYVDHTEENDDE
jgi:hypothetical protein